MQPEEKKSFQTLKVRPAQINSRETELRGGRVEDWSHKCYFDEQPPPPVSGSPALCPCVPVSLCPWVRGSVSPCLASCGRGGESVCGRRAEPATPQSGEELILSLRPRPQHHFLQYEPGAPPTQRSVIHVLYAIYLRPRTRRPPALELKLNASF